MSRRKKQRKLKTLKSHSSLNPEFDLANEAILDEIAKEEIVELICNRCGDWYPYNDHNKPGMYCSQVIQGTECGGQIYVDKDMIKLPENIKSGKKQYHSSPGYTTGYTGGTSYVYESHKHYGDKVIYEFEGKQLFASNGNSLDKASGKWDLIIDLAGVVNMPQAKNFIRNDAPKVFKTLEKYLDTDEPLKSEVLRLFWNDMSIPPCGIEFWINMWKILPAKTVICCVGGHGRTGTCIASLMIAAGETYEDALDHVRKEHCHKAVEVLIQEKYLHAIYVEMLNRDLKTAKAAGNLKWVKDITEDIEYALKNPPSCQNTEAVKSKVETKGSTKLPFDLTVAGSSVKKENPGSSTGDLVESQGDTPVWAKDLEQEVKTVGQKIYVKECTNKMCPTVDCREPAHQGWVEWDFTEEGVM